MSFKFFIVIALVVVSQTAFSETKLQNEMIRLIDAIELSFQTTYAPYEWKKSYANWDLEKTTEEARQWVRTNENPKVRDFHKILEKIFLSCKDYHVGYRFSSTNSASLPFEVRQAEGKFFLTYIDRKKLPLTSFPFNEGDELVNFNQQATSLEVDKIFQALGGNTKETDLALASIILTRRSMARAMDLPSDKVLLGIKRKGENKIVDHQLAWEVKEEAIDFTGLESTLGRKNNETKSAPLPRLDMISPLATSLADQQKSEDAANLYSIGGRKSFVPAMGKVLWETEETHSFYAALFMDEHKHMIGFVRIPSYGAGEKESKAFGELLNKFEEITDLLVIDQVNNPGGSVFYLYSLVSMFIESAVPTPRHQMALTHAMVEEAVGLLEKLKDVKDEAKIKEIFEEDSASGYPFSMSFVTMVKEYAKFIINEWKDGHLLTRPYHIWGVDFINPSPKYHYTKPVLLLTNELDFSGGDFFPAIMQDAKRVKILGVRTAGAGGYVLSQKLTNRLGLQSFSVTGSIAKRVSDNPIENLGVKPDVDYALSASDFQNGHKGYKEAILKSIEEMLK